MTTTTNGGLILPSETLILGKSLLDGEAVAAEARAAMLHQVAKSVKKSTPVYSMIEGLKRIGISVLPLFAESFWHSDMAAWLHAYEFNVNRMPEWLLDHMRETNRQPPRPPIKGLLSGFADDGDRVVFPMIREAAKNLIQRRVLTREEFDQVADDAKARSFTIAGDLTEAAIEQVRDTLADLTAKGPSLPEFTEAVQARLETSRIGSGHLENVYRTNIQAAYRDGREAFVQNPIVGAVFPYQEYIPIRDGRVRKEHLALGSLGLDGTGVYRRDDPFWDYWTPPCGYNCRCGVNLLTIEAAARKGVTEAQEWLETGRQPTNPNFRLPFIPFPPEPGFGQRTGRVAA